MTDKTDPPTKEKSRKANSGSFQKGGDPRRHVGSSPRRMADGRTVIQTARDTGPEVLAFWQEVMRDPRIAMRERLRASENLYDRGYGKAQQTVAIDATVEHHHQIATLDATAIPQEIRLALLKAKKALPAPDLIKDADFTPIADNRETDD